MARSESPDTRLLHSLVRRRLALLSIYSAQRLRDREQSTLLTSGGMPLNGIAQSDKAGCQTTCFSVESDGIYGNLVSTDISIKATCGYKQWIYF